MIDVTFHPLIMVNRMHQKMSKVIRTLLISLLSVQISFSCLAIGQPSLLADKNDLHAFKLVDSNKACVIAVDPVDYPGVILACSNLVTDIFKVTGARPDIIFTNQLPGCSAVIIGSVQKSRLIATLSSEKLININRITNKWETYQIETLTHPEHYLVIAGSDKRGTIYGIYEISQQIGVSPWYWWADVPIKHKDSILIKNTPIYAGPPAIKYRGIFINDEAPCLSDWVREKFKNYNHSFYTNVFELLLRLKANYLWPAMWNNAFNSDDPLNPKLADEFGIVIGSSHVEPMASADKEWSWLGYSEKQWDYEKYPDLLTQFWSNGIARIKSYEQIITVGMRGKVDSPMSDETKINLLLKIIKDQRQIIQNVFNKDPQEIPQAWVLYKEVQRYYDHGMRVPDDITIIFCDDNWQNIRRVPPGNELNRKGGYGFYFHLDYVGLPRNYKWLNTVQLPKIWEQLNIAYSYGIHQIWILNVGDIKPLEIPIEYFFHMAWNPRLQLLQDSMEYLKLWATREFGTNFASDIAKITAQYFKFNSRRKPELLDPTTYSVINFNEADQVLNEWQSIQQKAEHIYRQLPEQYQDAYYQLVLHPVCASANLNQLYITVAKNHLYARQGRQTANYLANLASEFFEYDSKLTDLYHRLGNGKWKHIMKQTHIGYTGWQQPLTNIMPKVQLISPPPCASPAVSVQGSENLWTNSLTPAILPNIDFLYDQQRYIDIINRGTMPFQFHVTINSPWLHLSQTNGWVTNEVRLWVKVDWPLAPTGIGTSSIVISPSFGSPVNVLASTFKPENTKPITIAGFYEYAPPSGFISIEATNYSKNVSPHFIKWKEIPDFGHTGSGMTPLPLTTNSFTPAVDSPHLEYLFYSFSTGKVSTVLYIAPTLNFLPNKPLRIGVSLDNHPPHIITILPEHYEALDSNTDWQETVKNNYRKIISHHTINHPGEHKLLIWMVDPGVVLQKLVIDFGGVRPSYLGPPQTYFDPRSKSLQPTQRSFLHTQ
jgi:hypothetical protein